MHIMYFDQTHHPPHPTSPLSPSSVLFLFSYSSLLFSCLFPLDSTYERKLAIIVFLILLNMMVSSSIHPFFILFCKIK
jgi:hypothetical protein